MRSETNSNRSERPIEILSVDDSAADQRLIGHMLSYCSHPHNLNFVPDGEEALKYLRRESPHLDARRPDLILLDLNLPRISGHDVLRAIRADESLKDILVLVLTTSESKDDALKCFELKASRLVKPGDLDRYRLILEAIERFCEKLNSGDWRELTEESLRKQLEVEREARRNERDELRTHIWDLEHRVAKMDAKIKYLEEAIQDPVTAARTNDLVFTESLKPVVPFPSEQN